MENNCQEEQVLTITGEKFQMSNFRHTIDKIFLPTWSSFKVTSQLLNFSAWALIWLMWADRKGNATPQNYQDTPLAHY